MERSKHMERKISNKTGIRSTFIRQSKACCFFLGDTQLGTKVLNIFDGIIFSLFITVITILTLYSDDVRQAFFPPESDLGFSILTLICMFIYVVQMIVLSLVKEGYFLGFYFWLDLISTLTMLLDLVWINQLLTGGEQIQAAASVAKIAKASRASKIGSRSTKLIRIIRLIRILRLYKTASHQLNKEHQQKLAGIEDKQLKKGLDDLMKRDSKRIDILKNQLSNRDLPPRRQSIMVKESSIKNIVFEGSNRRMSILHPSQKFIGDQKNSSAMIAAQRVSENMNFSKLRVSQQEKIGEHGNSNDHVVIEEHHPHHPHLEEDDIEVPKQTKVGSKLKEEIQKNIVSMIMLILISIPILNGDTWLDNETSSANSGRTLSKMTQKNQFEIYVKSFIDESQAQEQQLIYFDVFVNETCCQFPRDYSEYSVPSLEDLRNDQIDINVNYREDTFIYNQKSINVLSAKLNIGRTTFVCCLLIIVTLLFSRDMEIYALEPLENMISTVKRISTNPLQAIRDIEKQNIIREAMLIEEKSEQKLDQEDKTQPVILENMIIKIGSLLAVGFGEAGTQLIGRNIENHGSLNVMMPGKKSICIFGFCDIRNFTDATQILEANVMIFVNEIAQICHEVVNRVGGNPNKNIGDAFLLVWKFKDEECTTIQNRHQIILQVNPTLKVRQMADLAVYSFVKMVAEITRSPILQKYRNNPMLKARIKNYKGVKMGFGLHVGWAIEGPIGSEFKIDASYLSPHVNMASRLEGATKGYGVPLLISGDLFNLMTTKNKEYLRQVDRVLVKAGQDPVDLYTVDICSQSLFKHYGLLKKTNMNSFEKKKARVFHNQQRDKILEMIEKKRVTSALWKDDKDIKTMREPFSPFFFKEWKKGFSDYLEGKWDSAYEIFKKTLVLGLNNNDGPSSYILQFMESHEMTPPEDWKGVRQFNG